MKAPTTADADIRPVDLVVTRALSQRPNRAPDFPAELAALCELSQMVADAPREALRTSLDMTVRLCAAGSAGLSLLRLNAAGGTMVRWEAISGALALYEGTETPYAFDPCSLCLDTGVTMLVSQPERAFTCLLDARPAIVEELIVPLCDSTGEPLGAFWVAHHDIAARFCSNDARIAQQLAIQLLPALRLLRIAREHRYALALLESHQRAQHNLFARDLAEAHNLREHAEASESAVRRTLSHKHIVVQEAHHRAKNTLQTAIGLLSLHARQSPSAQVRWALQESSRRLHVLAKVHELLYASADSAQEIPMPTLLQAIGDAMRQSFTSISRRVRLEVASEPIVLCADEAIPMALLANEVLTNAYKHAFPNGCAGMISVNLSCAPGSAITLRIMDSGIGMGSKCSESGLGLKLIHSFAAQLHGTVAFSKPIDTDGTVMTLRIYRAAKRRQEIERGGSIASVKQSGRPSLRMSHARMN